MEVRSYNKELAYADLLFKRPFSNIEIERNGKTQKVKCIRGSRSRILKGLENPERKAIYQLPLIIIQRTGIQKNDERLANVWNEVKYRSSSTRMNYNLFTPVPIDITYTVTIVSKYQSDIDMIVSNFIPFFNKDLFFQCDHPKYTGLTYKNQVIMDNSIQEEHLDELDPSVDDIVTSTCTFTFKTSLFCGTLKTQKVIKEIIEETISTDVIVTPTGSVSSYVYELTDKDMLSLDMLLKENGNPKLSTMLTTTLSGEVSAYVSSVISNVISVEEEVTEGLIPQVNTIGIGFYDPPIVSGHTEFIDFVDSLCANGYDDKPGVDRFIMHIDTNYNVKLKSPYPSQDWDWEGWSHEE